MAQLGDWEVYQSLPELASDGTIDYDSHTFKALLLVAHTPNLATHDELADISGDEHASANGYARVTLTNVVWSKSGATTKFSADPIVFAASGGNIVASHIAIFDDTATGDKLVEIAEFQDDMAAADDIVVTDGNSLTITPHATDGFLKYVIV